MTYTISQLAALSGMTTRALRHYDKLGLLKPSRIKANGYRIYGAEEVDRLQHILLYRELGLPLKEIKGLLSAGAFDARATLESHLSALKARKVQLDALIANVEKTIQSQKGEISMTDQEKFEGLKAKMVQENEQRYGQEARAKYGDEAIDQANAKLAGMSQAQFARGEALTAQLNDTLKAAVLEGNPAGELAQKACALHKAWLLQYWPSYSKEAHMAIAQTYVDDPRFTAYYDKISPGTAQFLRDALIIYCKD